MDGQHQAPAASSPPPSEGATELTLLGLLHQQQLQQQQMQQLLAQLAQQRNPAAQLLTLQSMGQLQPFQGRADASGLAAREWLTHAEVYFAAGENALGVSEAQGNPRRVLMSRLAMQGDAQRWLASLPTAPNTWKDFREAFTQRFSSLPAAQVREAALQRFVDAAKAVRARLSLDGLQRYTTLFLQHAGEIPAERMTDASKRMLYAQGLPAHHAEFVLREDAKEDAMPLHELAQAVCARATLKAHASGSAAAVSSPLSSSEAMQIDAVSLAAVQFGVSREEAATYFEAAEGWAPHDTAGSTGAPSSWQQEMLAALHEFRQWRGGARNGPANKSRKLPQGVTQEQWDERRKNGECFLCGSKEHRIHGCPSKKPSSSN
jgi:hypothetical protein